ncbi:WhiB family transcriptional regulator [Aestuariimicrobium ganziense]|uniref:WhiB family transcriptional regulator n=1 Tax=Aestuariimicrobium ganziense TaxID=2773677 RepID=UPI0019409DAE|nr:WhiB family transcriptional regulator [Aestuariimicrobium ganziense]
MSITAPRETVTPACTEYAGLFQHRLLEDSAAAGSVDERRQQAMMTRKAENLCLECPLMTQCLYNAVVKFDVAGYVAGTTPRQRSEMRSILGIRVQPEDFDTLAGVTTPNRQVDHDEVVRLRNANPYESLESIAQRLGCSLSTVKRHLRKARAAQEQPKARLRRVEPTLAQVIAAYQAVLTRRSQRTTRAA